MLKKHTIHLALSLLLSVLCLAPITAQNTMRISAKGLRAAQWATKAFAKGVIPPFSFTYGGLPSADFITRWNYRAETLPSTQVNVTERSYSYTDPATGLRVECRVKLFADFNAAEWVLRFTNTSDKDTPEIAQVKVVDLTTEYTTKGGFKLHYADGSHVSKEDFHSRTKPLAPGDTHSMASQGGRSSQQSFPFFNVQGPDGGILYAIGWTGNWRADISRSSERATTVATAMKNLATYLRPQEVIRTPSTALLLWEGPDRMTGQNSFRRFLLAHHSPKVDGQTAQFPICSSFNYGDPAPCNEYSCLTADYAIALVRRYVQFGLVPEVFWLDAGWYSKAADYADNRNWANTVGNWTVDAKRFPEGLGPIADEVHRAGAKFMVWFEPERVIKDTQWAAEHPEFMLDASGQAVQPDWIKHGNTDSYLFNLGDDRAHAWFCQQIGDMIEQNRIDYYRQDFNIEPEGFWYANDEKGRVGICEVRYIEGLYKFWDYLRERFPSLLIDNCASGGRRIDLESTSRSAPLWRTDYNYGEPIGYQCHTYGLHLWLPIHGTGTHYSDSFTFRSSLGATIIYNWKITNGNTSIFDMQKRMEEFAAVRPYFMEDYYPLTGFGDMTGSDIWLAYQLQRPSDQSGYVVAFRRDASPEATKQVHLQGLEPDALYLVRNLDSGSETEQTGRTLMDGYTLELPNPRSSLLLNYRRK